MALVEIAILLFLVLCVLVLGRGSVRKHMTSNDDAFQLKRRAIEIVKKRGIYESLNWIFEGWPLGLSSQLKVSTDRTKKDFKKCQEYFRFDFNNHKYELFLENGRSFPTPDDTHMLYWGDVRLVFDNELVFKSKYERPDFGKDYKLITAENAVDVIRLSDWVNDLPVLTDLAKKALDDRVKKETAEDDAKKAEHIRRNVDLGKFS